MGNFSALRPPAIASGFLAAVLWAAASPLAAAPPASDLPETPFSPLLKQVSPDANVLVMIDAERIRRTDFGRSVAASEGDASASSHIVARSEVSQILLAAHIRGFRESMIDWQTALLLTNTEPSVAGVAANYGGSVEEIGPTEYAVLPYGAVAVSTGKNILAVLTPPDRQQVSRIVRLSKTTKPAPPSEFLVSTAAQLGPKADALIAVDLEGMFARSQILAYVQSSETFRDKADVRIGAANVLESLKSLTIRVRFRDQPTAELTLEFSKSVPDTTAWGKDLFEEVLSDTGAWISDIENWQARREDNRVILEGPLSLSGLRQMFSLVEFPTEVPTEYQPDAKLSPEEEKRRMAKASLARFRACDKLVEDLKKDNKAKTQRPGENALWFDRYARQIEVLPSLNVDPEVLEYCDDVVLRLRVQATRYRMASLRISQEQTQPSYFWGYFTNYYGNTYSYWTRQESDAARTKRYERAGAAMDRAEQFQAIAEEGVKVRRSMTARYKAEF